MADWNTEFAEGGEQVPRGKKMVPSNESGSPGNIDGSADRRRPGNAVAFLGHACGPRTSQEDSFSPRRKRPGPQPWRAVESKSGGFRATLANACARYLSECHGALLNLSGAEFKQACQPQPEIAMFLPATFLRQISSRPSCISERAAIKLTYLTNQLTAAR
jgi:hypothetical protein